MGSHPPVLIPLDAGQREEVLCATGARIREAEGYFQRDFAPVPVAFDLSGRVAGQFQFRRWPMRPRYRIRFNPWVFAADLPHHLQDTVAHEVAHYIIHVLDPAARAHGREWKELMVRFGATPRASSPYDLTGVPLRMQRRHQYRCGCRDRVHAVTTTRHNRILKGTRYLCRQCRQPLQTR